jgi:hypothetical protein
MCLVARMRPSRSLLLYTTACLWLSACVVLCSTALLTLPCPPPMAARHFSHTSPFLHKQKRWEAWTGPAFVVQAKHCQQGPFTVSWGAHVSLLNFISACLTEEALFYQRI